MSIKSIHKSNYVLNVLDENDTFQSLIDYLSQNINEWTSLHLIWDLSKMDFSDITTGATIEFSESIKKLAKPREGLKTAIIVSSAVGYGNAKVIKGMVNLDLAINIKIFYDSISAKEWVLSED